MKKFIVLGVLFLTLTMVSQEKVGEVRNGDFVITASLDLLKPEWARLSKNAGKDEVLNFSIIKKAYEDGTPYYFLYATNSKKSIGIATHIDLESGVFNRNVVRDIGGTVTCTGCAFGCDPTENTNGTYQCAPPCDKCNKTTTINLPRFSSK